jgi:hypothetical protein
MTTSDWRSLIRIHPAADLFPMMSPDDLRVLGEDIKANGLSKVVVTCDGQLLDGRNRLDAMELAGLPIRAKTDSRYGVNLFSKQFSISTPLEIHSGNHDPYAYVVSANIHRRHLTTAQKSELIAKLLKADPTKSDRAIAATVKVDNKTVAAKRAKLEASEEIPQLTERTGADGKTRKQPTKSEIAAALQKGGLDAAEVALQKKLAEEPATSRWGTLGTPEEGFTAPCKTIEIAELTAADLRPAGESEEEWEDRMLAGLDEVAKLKVAQAAIAGIRKEARMLGKLAATAHQRVWLHSLQYDLDSFEADWFKEAPTTTTSAPAPTTGG